MTSAHLDTAHPDDDLETVIALMEREQVRRIPVVSDDNRLAGVIAQADLAMGRPLALTLRRCRGRTAAVRSRRLREVVRHDEYRAPGLEKQRLGEIWEKRSDRPGIPGVRNGDELCANVVRNTKHRGERIAAQLHALDGDRLSVSREVRPVRTNDQIAH